MLFVLIVNVVSTVLDISLGFMSLEAGIGVISAITSLALLLPGICVTVRRLHDLDRSGWWILIAFVPIVGFIVLLVFMIMRGTEGPNRFGADPLAGEY